MCPARAPLSVRVVFPDCWDGRRTDSPDHTAHVARSRDGRCPDTHPVPVPQLIFEIRYPIHGDGHEVELASGGVHSVNADFINAWDQRALERDSGFIGPVLRRERVENVRDRHHARLDRDRFP